MTALTPFRIDIPEAQLVDLSERIRHTRWPDDPTDVDWSRGVPLQYLKSLAEYWCTGYDFRKYERELNDIPQFTTSLDGQTIHFLHVRSPHAEAMPLIATHGWPGSFVELLEIVRPLTYPTDRGGSPSDAFHLVIPSLPGFGFSIPRRGVGWTDVRIAHRWADLMQGLGYERYAAYGGDFGAKVSRALGLVDAQRVIAVYVTEIGRMLSRDEADPTDAAERRSVEVNERYQRELSGYGYVQSTRPQTLAYALSDSPVGQLAWIAEKFKDWTDSSEVPEDSVDRDQMLTNVTIYWLTGTAGSSAHLYADGASRWLAPEIPSSVPTGVAAFRRNIWYSTRRVAEQTNNIVHWTEFERGGHFPAMEQPRVLVEDMRKFFRGFRSAI